MKLEQRNYGEALLVTVAEPRIDASVAIQFKDRLRQMTEGGPDRVILDLRQVQFLDSSGLGAVVAAKKQLGPNRSLELADFSPMVEKVFQLTRMDSVFTIHRDAAAALGGLRPVS